MELPDDTENTVYVSHKLVRQPKYKGKWKEKFLKFYLIDQTGREQLAATAEDTGDAHYIYTSSENFKNYGVVSCRNREELILWLEMVIKKSQMKAAGQKTSSENEHYNELASYQFVGHRLEKLILEDGRRCNRWYLVDSDSNEHLAVVGKERCASDGHYDYKAEEPFASRYPLRCSNLQGVLRWVAHMITPQAGQANNLAVTTTRGTPLATNSGGNGSGEVHTPGSRSPARSFAMQSQANPSKRRKLAPATAQQQQGTPSLEDMLVSRPRWAASPGGGDQLEGSYPMQAGEPQHDWDTNQQVKQTRARQPSMAQGGSRLRDPSAPKERADQEDMLIADALVDLQQVQHKNQDSGALVQHHLAHAHSGAPEPMGQLVTTTDMDGADPNSVQGLEEGGEMYTGNINQKLIFDPQLQCQWSMRARNAVVTKGKLLARMKAGVYVYDSEQQELVRLEDTAYNRMKSRIKDSFGKVFSSLAVEQNITDPCHPAYKVTPAGTVSVGLFATDNLGPGTILGDYLFRAVMETYAENEHYVMMDPTGKRALQEMYSMDLAFTSSWEGDALVALGHPARNTLACMNDYRALPQGNNKPQRRMCTNTPCNCHSYARRTPNVELLETIEITSQRTIIPHLLVLTKRRVAHGDEILWDFGADFWERYEALVRRVHYVESQSQELERMKQTVELSQHQLTALQNYIYEREQVITKLQQVMAMQGLNAEQALQMQLPFPSVVQDENGHIIPVDGMDPSAGMVHSSMPAQVMASDHNQLIPLPLPALPTQLSDHPMSAPDSTPATDSLPNGMLTQDQHAHADLQVLAFASQMQSGMAQAMGLPGVPAQHIEEQEHSERPQLMQPLPSGQMTIDEMQGGQGGQLPLTLQHLQQPLPEQLPADGDVQFLREGQQGAPGGVQVQQGSMHISHADVAQMHLHTAQQALNAQQQLQPGAHNMGAAAGQLLAGLKPEGSAAGNDAMGANQTQIMPQQMEHMDHIAHMEHVGQLTHDEKSSEQWSVPPRSGGLADGLLDMPQHGALQLEGSSGFEAQVHGLGSYALPPVPAEGGTAGEAGKQITTDAKARALQQSDVSGKEPSSALVKEHPINGALLSSQHSIPVSEPVSWPSQECHPPNDSPSITYSTVLDTAPDQLQHTNPANTDVPGTNITLAHTLTQPVESSAQASRVDSKHADSVSPSSGPAAQLLDAPVGDGEAAVRDSSPCMQAVEGDGDALQDAAP